MNATLVIMAAGMASRFGGMKQIERVGVNDEVIADFSVYDAKKAGFNKIIFVIKKEHEKIFDEMFVNNIKKHINTEYVFQEMTDLPDDFKNQTQSIERTKPWGTAHAVLACRDTIKEHFAVINADDFYGSVAFEKIIAHFKDTENGLTSNNYCTVGFELKNTISEHGTVSRGLCDVTSDGYLSRIEEALKIKRLDGNIIYEKPDGSFKQLSEDTLVSMNIWGFTPAIFNDFNNNFHRFLNGNFNDMTAEFLLPFEVGNLVENKKATVKMLSSSDKWYGVTYKDDVPFVKNGLKELVKSGQYPEKLWR